MPSTKKTFRLFVSSTFSDMKLERHLLQSKVFPRLEQLCHSHGADFQGIDLRWGVSEDTQLDQKTMRLCLEEIAHCQRLTPEPNFIALLGDRYGWQPLPDRIPSGEMERILKACDSEARQLLETWYREDLNAVPPEYVLLRRDGEYRTYETWAPVERSLLDLLRSVVDTLGFNDGERVKYFASATHQEIISGALQLPPGVTTQEDNVLVCMRTIRNLPENKEGGEYLDLVGDHRDPYTKASLDVLKAELKTRLPDSNRYEYNAALNTKNELALDDSAAFVEWTYTNLSRLIQNQLQQVPPMEDNKEFSIHEDFGAQQLEHFTGREEILASIQEYVASPNGKPLLITGPSGSGKSSVMAMAAERAFRQGCLVVVRFIGLSQLSSQVQTLLRSLCDELSDVLGRQTADYLKSGETEANLNNPELLGTVLARILEEGSFLDIALFIDALDQVDGGIGSTLARLLPTNLPKDCRLVMSALPEWTVKFPQAAQLQLKAMPQTEAGDLLNKWLKKAGRTLQKKQTTTLLEAFTKNGLPLFLRLAFEKAKNTHSFEKLETGSVIAEELGLYFDELEKEHSVELVTKVVQYLLAGRYGGLKEDEIVALLAFDSEFWDGFVARSHPAHRSTLLKARQLPIAVWSRLHLDLEPFLAERDAEGESVLCFFHRQFREYALERYGSKLAPTHDILARFFEASPLYFDKAQKHPNRRKAMEQVWQQRQAGRWQNLEQLSLGSFDFVMMKFKSELAEQIIGEYRELEKEGPAETKERMRLWTAFIRENSNVLRRGNKEWPAYKLLLQLAVEHADDSPVTLGAEKWLSEGHCNWLWIARKQRLSHATVSNILATLEGHTEWICSMLELVDGRIVSCSEDHTFRIWAADGTPLRTVQTGHGIAVEGIMQRADGSLVTWSWKSEVRVWTSEGDFIMALDLYNNNGWRTKSVEEFEDGTLFVRYGDGTTSLWTHEGDLVKATIAGDLVTDNIGVRHAKTRYSTSAGSTGFGHMKLSTGLELVWESTNIIYLIDVSMEDTAHPDRRELMDKIMDLMGETKQLEGHAASYLGGIPEALMINGRVLTANLFTEGIMIWDVADGHPIRTMKNNPLELNPIAFPFGPDHFIIYNSDDKGTHQWFEIRDMNASLVRKIICPKKMDLLCRYAVTGENRIIASLFNNHLIIMDSEGNILKDVIPWKEILGDRLFHICHDGRIITWEGTKLSLWSPELEPLENDWGSDFHCLRTPKGKSIEDIGDEEHYKSILGAVDFPNGYILSWDSGRVLLRRDGDISLKLLRLGYYSDKEIVVTPDNTLMLKASDTKVNLWSKGEWTTLTFHKLLRNKMLANCQFGKKHLDGMLWHERLVPGKNERSKSCHLLKATEAGFKSLAQWHAESLCTAWLIDASGTLLATQRNGQVCFLQLYKGADPIGIKRSLR